MQKKCHVFEIGKSEMRPTWTYKLGQNISIEKEENDLGVVIKNNLSPEKRSDKMISDLHDTKEFTDGLSLG